MLVSWIATNCSYESRLKFDLGRVTDNLQTSYCQRISSYVWCEIYILLHITYRAYALLENLGQLLNSVSFFLRFLYHSIIPYLAKTSFQPRQRHSSLFGRSQIFWNISCCTYFGGKRYFLYIGVCLSGRDKPSCRYFSSCD